MAKTNSNVERQPKSRNINICSPTAAKQKLHWCVDFTK